MIIGAHSIIYSTNPEADRAFLRDALKLSHVDAGHGWLIFGLPPAEVAAARSARAHARESFACRLSLLRGARLECRISNSN